MQPSDHPVDADADPTRVRPDRQPVSDREDGPDAGPTAVRPRFAATEPAAEPAAVEPSGGPAVGSASETVVGGWGRTAGDHGYARDDADGLLTADAPEVPRHPSHRADPWPTPARNWLTQQEPGGTSGQAGPDADTDPDGGPTTVLTVAHESGPPPRRRDWAWVEEWRAERTAPAWGPGIATGIFVALIVAVALIVLTSGVSDSPVLAVVFNVVIAAGMAPALWLCRSLPVLRFLAAGAAVGILAGWIWMITTF